MDKLKGFIVLVILATMLALTGGCYSSSASAANMFETTATRSTERTVATTTETTPTATPKPTSKPKAKKTNKKSTKKTSKKSSKKSKKKKKSKKSYRVYWTEYGECYHRRNTCFASRRYYYGSVSSAKSLGLRPCKKCC